VLGMAHQIDVDEPPAGPASAPVVRWVGESIARQLRASRHGAVGVDRQMSWPLGRTTKLMGGEVVISWCDLLDLLDVLGLDASVFLDDMVRVHEQARNQP